MNRYSLRKAATRPKEAPSSKPMMLVDVWERPFVSLAFLLC